MSLIEEIKKKVQYKDVRIAFPEFEDERIIKAVRFLKDHKLVEPILVGKNISNTLHDIDISDIEKIDVDNKKYANELYELRKSKITYKQEEEVLNDSMYFATMLLKNNLINGIVSGAIHPTSHTIRPAIQIIKGKEEFENFVSSYFIMEKEDSLYFFSDCALNPNHTARQLAQIAIQTGYSARSYNLNPKIAMLSFSTNGSAKHELVDKVKDANIYAKQMIDRKKLTFEIDGEMQLDAAIVESVASLKFPKSRVAGHANVLIFPDLNAGNIGYKLVQRFGKYNAIGPVLQGLKMPINDLSRGCNVNDIVDVACITANQFLNIEN